MATNPMVKFKFGQYSGFKALTSYDAGTLYVTTDEQGMYFAKDSTSVVKLGNIITYNTLTEWESSTTPPYSADVFYYITQGNALLKFNGTKFVQLNKDYGTDVSDILATIGANTDTVAAGKTTLWAKINEAKATADAASTAAATADNKAVAAQSTADSALGKANTNANDITTIKSNISAINEDITDLEAIVVTGDDSNAKLRADISTNATAASNAQTKANDAYALAQTADGKADTNAGAIDDINDAIGADNTANTIKGRIKANETAISEINTAIGTDSTSNSIKGRIKANEDAIAGHGTAIQNIQNNYATKTYAENEADAAENAAKGYADTEIGKAKTDLIGTEVTGVTNTIKGVKKYADEQIAGVNTSINTLSNQIGNLSNIMNFRGTFDSTDDVTSPVNGDVIIVGGIEHVYVKESEAAEGKWEPFGAATATDARFDAIEQDISDLDARVTALDKVDGRIETIEDRMSTAESDIGTNATAIATEKGRVDTLVNTTIPGIEAKIGTVANGTNLAQMIANETSRATGVENGLKGRLDTLDETTIPAINTAHSQLADRVTALDQATTGRVALVEADVSTLEAKTGIENLTGNDTLYSLITAEVNRATEEEQDIRTDFAAADSELDTKFTNALTWGTF